MTIKAGKVRMGRVLKTMGVLNDHIEAMSVGRLLVQGKFDKVNPGTIDRCIEQGLVYESWDPATKITEPKLTGFGRLVANGAASAR